jgi:hypothetical protein
VLTGRFNFHPREQRLSKGLRGTSIQIGSGAIIIIVKATATATDYQQSYRRTSLNSRVKGKIRNTVDRPHSGRGRCMPIQVSYIIATIPRRRRGVLLSIVPRSITKTRAPFCAIMEQWQGCAVSLGSEKDQRYVLCKSLAKLRGSARKNSKGWE